MKKLSTLALLTVAGLIATSTAALAVDAIVKSDANVRAKPKTSSSVVNTVAEDDEVKVLDCQGSWCKIKIDGPDGWVKKSVLAAIDEDGEADPEVPFHMSVGPGGISFGIGDTPAPAPVPAAVCFFHDVNYAGPSACFGVGEADDHMVGVGYNDEISSVRIAGGLHVKVCRDWGFGGGCAVYGADKPWLGSYDETISSFQVY